MKNELQDEPKEEKIKYFARFLGGDQRFWNGVPAKDLTEEQWNKIDEELQDTLLQIKLYELIDPPAVVAPEKVSKKKDGE